MATTDVPPLPRLREGDRCFSHYVMRWGTVTHEGTPAPELRRGEPTGHWDTWHLVRWDDGGTDNMNDGGTRGPDAGRIMRADEAGRYGYGADPHAGEVQAVAGNWRTRSAVPDERTPDGTYGGAR